MQSENESMSYETVLTLLGEDYCRAFSVYREMGRLFNLSDPLPSYASALSDLLGTGEEEINRTWRSVRDCYQRIRGTYEILDERSPFFPSELLKSEYPVPFIYALGNLRLLEKESMTVIGGLSPSAEAVKTAESASAFINSNGIVLLTPLRLGISSIAIAETIKESGNVIAFSSSFVTKAPNERLRDQMLDIYKRGGLILSATGPARKEDKWHQVIRNRAISSLSDSVFLVEEKDGGPSWKIFDSSSSFIPKAVWVGPVDQDNYSFIRSRIEDGAYGCSDIRELKKLLRKKERRRRVKTDLSLTPDLF